MGSPDVAVLQAEIKAEFPSFSIGKKSDSAFMRLLGLFMGKRFMEEFITTVGFTTYVPSEWDLMSVAEQCAVLRHERVHMRQARRFSVPLFSLLYLLAPIPMFFAWFRTRFEQEAYAETLKAAKEYGMDWSSPERKATMVSYFTSSAYGFMWCVSGPIERWFDATVKALEGAP